MDRTVAKRMLGAGLLVLVGICLSRLHRERDGAGWQGQDQTLALRVMAAQGP